MNEELATNEELAKRMLNPYDFTDRTLEVGF